MLLDRRRRFDQLHVVGQGDRRRLQVRDRLRHGLQVRDRLRHGLGVRERLRDRLRGLRDGLRALRDRLGARCRGQLLADGLEHAVDVAAGVVGGQALGQLHHLVDDHGRGRRLVLELVGPEPQRVAVHRGHAGQRPSAREPLHQRVELVATLGDAGHQRPGEPVDGGSVAAPRRRDAGVLRVGLGVVGRALDLDVGRLVRVEVVEQGRRPTVGGDLVEQRDGVLTAHVGLVQQLERAGAGASRVAGVGPALAVPAAHARDW